MFWCLLIGLSWGQDEPSDHTVVYYNARMALREGRPLEASQWWLLRNAMEDKTGQISPHDGDFHSVTWAALGEMGVCQDGYPNDVDGAGLWPIALHNWVVRNRSRRARDKPPRPFDAFELGRQQRFISIGDVVGGDELQTVQMFRGVCSRPRLALLNAGESVLADLSDRQVSARLLLYLLERARDTLVLEQVRGAGTIEARLFDLHLQLTALAAREARLNENERARKGRQIGLSSEAVRDMRDEADPYTFSPSSAPARILRESVDWDPTEWIALSAERRLFLYDHAKTYNGNSDALDRIALAVIDHLIEQEDGEGVEKWIAHRSEDLQEQQIIWGGERGQRLLALDSDTGFRERSVIALHRGVNQLETGDLPSALRSMAYALQLAPESRVSEEVQSLSLRWLSYIASQFEVTDELLITLKELVPRRDYAVILEDLMWGAAFRADKTSFERGIRNQSGHGALERRIAMLHPLAKGDVGRFSNQLRINLDDSPSEALRFLDQLVQRLELEDADVRTVHLRTLSQIRLLLAPLSEDESLGRSGRRAAELMSRTQAIMEGLDGLGDEASTHDRARAINPNGEVYAGSIRLAPVDPLPWPFKASRIPAPSVFSPIDLTPVEWRDDDNEWVYGWSITG